MLNTEAESVEDITAASRKHITMDSESPIFSILDRKNMNAPVMMTVSRTPTVDSTIPGAATGFMSLYLVSRPPVNRITHRATILRNWARL